MLKLKAHRPLLKTYEHKDSHRYWWSVKVWHSGDFVTSNELHYEWTYEIFRDKKFIHLGVIIGQWDIQPTLQEILYDFMSYLQGVAIGFSKHGKEM